MWTRHVHTLGFCEWLVVAAFLMGWRILLWPGDDWARPVHLLVTLVGNKPGWQDKIGWMIPFDSECEETAPTRLSNEQREGEEASVCKRARISALVTKINWRKTVWPAESLLSQGSVYSQAEESQLIMRHSPIYVTQNLKEWRYN